MDTKKLIIKINICICVGLLNLNSCIKEKTPIEVDHDFNYYLNSWPDTIYAEGIGSPNPDLPTTAQRSSAIENAKLKILENLKIEILKLPISETESMSDLLSIEENILIKSRVDGFARGFSVYDTTFLNDGTVKVKGMLQINDLREEVRKFLIKSKT